jgi:Asp-tRNA(Asn)/Glu-tRNA(Gln) amidotransferase A subunit family amidase
MGEPALADDILSRSATDILSLYRSKQVSPVEVLTATLDRIDRLDRFYNAFVMIDRQGAFYMRRRRKGVGDMANRTATSMDCR